MSREGAGGDGSLRWAVDTTAAMSPHLVPGPEPGPGVCRCCRGRARPDFALCFCCREVLGALRHPCPRVVPISLYRPGGFLHRVLRGYKDGADPVARRACAELVAGLASCFLWREGARVSPDGWDGLVVVPSTAGRPGRHPLAAALDGTGWLAGQITEALRPGPGRCDHGRPADDGFVPAGPVAGRRLLVLDDTYTTGARAQSAASVLAGAGAEVAAVVVVGRVVTPERSGSGPAWWARATAGGAYGAPVQE